MTESNSGPKPTKENAGNKKPWPAWMASFAAVIALIIAISLFEKPRRYCFNKVFSLVFVWLDVRYVSGLSEIDAVEICLLKKPADRSAATNRIYGAEVIKTTNLVGAPAQELAALWRQLPTISDPMEQILCHFPVYGLRFSKDGKRVLESSYCWNCANISVPSSLGCDELRFDETEPAATNLFFRLRSMFSLEEMTNAARSYFKTPPANFP